MWLVAFSFHCPVHPRGIKDRVLLGHRKQGDCCFRGGQGPCALEDVNAFVVDVLAADGIPAADCKDHPQDDADRI